MFTLRLTPTSLGAIALAVSVGMVGSGAGCGDDGGTGGAGGTAPSWNGAIEWAPCADDDPAGPGVECASIAVPANWGEPAGSSITFVVRRIRAEESRGQLWLLAGGPGQPGWVWVGVGAKPYFDQIAPGLDLYFPDHRGTGDSDYVRCADTKSPGGVVDCVKRLESAWGDDVPFFNTTQAARDVGEIAARMRDPDDELFVLGSSYGSTWGHRYLQLFPDQPSGVILDSPCPPGTCNFSVSHAQVGEGVGRLLFDLCSEDAVCSTKLGPDPWVRVGALLDALDAGHCPSLVLRRSDASAIFKRLLSEPETRGYLPAVVYRIERCAAADVEVVQHLLSTPFARQAEDTALGLLYHVVLSELFPEPAPTLDEARAELAPLWIVDAASLLYFAQARPLWPVYPRDEYVGTYATTETPILTMTGTLDPATPPAIASPFGEHYQGAHQHYVEVERAGHGVLSEPCGAALIAAFIEAPSAPLDTSCATETPPIDFVGTPEKNEQLLGTPDAYENE